MCENVFVARGRCDVINIWGVNGSWSGRRSVPMLWFLFVEMSCTQEGSEMLIAS